MDMKSAIRLFVTVMAAAALTVSCVPESEREPKNLEVIPATTTPGALDTEVIVEVKCDLSWTVKLQDDSWGEVEVKKVEKGTGGTFVFKTGVNTADGSRKNNLIVKAGNGEKKVAITQNGLSSFFTPRYFMLDGVEESTITFNSPESWKAEIIEGSEWFTLKTTSGGPGEASLVCAAKEENNIEEALEGKIRLTIGSNAFEIQVTQKAGLTDPIMKITQPGIYGIAGRNYVFGVDGWNQQSLKKDADGTMRYCLMHAGTFSAVTVSGLKNASKSAVSLAISEEGFTYPAHDYAAILIAVKEGMWWFKVNEDTYFIIQE